MEQALGVHRLHFAFTIVFHYIFPQLTMGLALLLVYLKTKALRTKDEHYNRAARFWARIFGINFAVGVATGIPMEFQFCTNWATFWSLLVNKWVLWQFALPMLGAVQTGCFVMAAVGAFYLLTKRHEFYGRTFVKAGVLVGVVAAVLQLFPTGDEQGKLIAEHQPVTLAAMEGLFVTESGAPLVIIGQPDVQKRRLDNPVEIPSMLSFLTYKQWAANVRGLDAFPQDQWPDTIPLLYYSYHVMVGLGTIFIAVMVLAALMLGREKLYHSRGMLWALMICVPLPYIANTAGWMTAELGRQPWLIYGIMRTAHGASPQVDAQARR